MASRTGPRAVGTDGSDFQHREKVAANHKISVTEKARLKKYLLINIFISVSHILLFIISTVELLDDSGKYQPALWQAFWTLSGIASLFGLAALPKNRSGLLKLHNGILILFGIGGICWGLVSNYERILSLWDGSEGEQLFGVPKVIIIYNISVLTFALYMSTLFSTRTLLRSWDYRKSK